MTPSSVRLAIRAAERFIGLAKGCLGAENALNSTDLFFRPSKDRAEMKRASLDLSRRLAEMRKP